MESTFLVEQLTGVLQYIHGLFLFQIHYIPVLLIAMSSVPVQPVEIELVELESPNDQQANENNSATVIIEDDSDLDQEAHPRDQVKIMLAILVFSFVGIRAMFFGLEYLF